MREHLLEWLQDLGWVWPAGMGGAVAVPHSEINAWARNCGVRFDGQEAAWLHDMSRAYAEEIARSDGKDRAAPYEAET